MERKRGERREEKKGREERVNVAKVMRKGKRVGRGSCLAGLMKRRIEFN